LYATDGLDVPSNINITYNKTTPDKRYLHLRGLYIDHLETLAARKISDALGTCTSSDKTQCVFPLLPFTTINLTELANWCVTPTGASCPTNQVIQVSNNAIIGGDPNDPQRGVVIAESTAKTGDKSTAHATIAISNSGVAVGEAVDPNDALNPLTDGQDFTVTSGVAATSVPFTLNLSGLPNLTDNSQTDDPSASWKIGTATAVPCALARQGNKVDHYTCTTTSISPTSTDVIIGPYNTATASANSDKKVLCSGGPKVTWYTCQNYQVGTVTLNTVAVSPSVTPASDGLLSEQSTVTFATLDGSQTNTINIAFTLQGTTDAPYTCSGTSVVWTYPTTFCKP